VSYLSRFAFGELGPYFFMIEMTSRHLTAQKRMAMELMKGEEQEFFFSFSFFFLFFCPSPLLFTAESLVWISELTFVYLVGRRGVWLDPEKKDELALAKTRASIRDLIEKGTIRRAVPRHRQKFVMPPQYMSRYRQRLLCDRAVRSKPRFRKKEPSGGKRYYEPKYWKKKAPEMDEAYAEEIRQEVMEKRKAQSID
jgi:ribosomal protein L19E